MPTQRTMTELADILKQMYADGKPRDVSVRVCEFGIIHGDAIYAQGQTASSIAALVKDEIGDWGPQINLGRKLAQHGVTVAESVRLRWQ